MTDSDSIYHQLFSHPIMVEHLVRDFLPDAMAVGLDFTRMAPVPAKFHQRRRRTARRESDVIWHLPTREGQGVYLYVMLEFQATSDWWMAVRAQVYEGLLWQHIIAQGHLKEGQFLPPVLLVVLYNGGPPWTAPTDTADLIALPADSPLWPWQPRIRYHLLDMGRVNDDDLVGRASLAALLVRLERRQEPAELERVIEDVIAWFRAHPDYDDLKRLFTELVGQALQGTGVPERIPDDLVEMKTMLATLGEDWKQTWLAEGRAEGEARGRAEGEARGRVEERTDMLIRLAEYRFGPLSSAQRARIEAADQETMASWEKRLFEARTLDDLLAPPH